MTVQSKSPAKAGAGPTAAELRAIEIAERLDSRRNAARDYANAPDGCEGQPRIGHSDATVDKVESMFECASTERGFWKDSENLRCRAGLGFTKGDLDMTRFQRFPWVR